MPAVPDVVHLQPATGPGAELRASPRYTMLIRAAKLRSPAGEFLCVVRDASDTGVNIRLFHPLPDPLPETAPLVLELQNGDCHDLDLVWQEEEKAGLRFRAEADIARIIECPSRFAKRPVRVTLDAPGRMSAGPLQAGVTIHDMSQQGAKVTSATRFAIDQRVRLSAHCLPEVEAKVRWRRGEVYGLVFEDTFQFGDLARIVAAMQRKR